MNIVRSILSMAKSLLKIFLYGFLAMIGYMIAAPITLSILGYYPDGIGWEVAGTIVKNNGKASDCEKIIHTLPHLLSPSGGEQRSGCIHEFAKMKKDPSACELLMPSSYGLSCVGAATKFNICSMGRDSVTWSENGEAGSAAYSTCTKDDSRRSKRGNQCCMMARASFVLSENDCSSLSADQVMYDECQNRVAFKNHDPSLCDAISDPNIKAGCGVNTRALQKDPSICTGCTPPVESIDQLPR